MNSLRHHRFNLLVLIALLAASTAASRPAAAADPDFGPNVLIFDPSMTDIQGKIDSIFKRQEANQFGRNRYAYLFKPGNYKLDVQVGFYMHVAGLGESPDDVSITGAVRCMARWMGGNNATCNFWRAVENLSVTPTQNKGNDVWAVSQAVSLRRSHIKGNLTLHDNGGWSSGGFMADCKIDGGVNSGSQQQWLSRNDDWKEWKGANWNMVFVGVNKPPAGNWPSPPYTVVDKVPVIAEKPFLTIDKSGHYSVFVPSVQENTSGITWGEGKTPGKSLPIEQFYVAHPGKDNAASINAALGEGKNLLLTPGIYHLESSIRVSRPGTIVFGLGLPTLEPEKGTPAMVVADVDGVRVSGILFDASKANSPTLLQIGEEGKSTSHAKDPIILYDIFGRAGGAGAGSTDCMVTINSNDVVGDDFWLWRADHGEGAGWNSNKNANGLIVNGDRVTFYGLFVEHSQQYQTLWNGNDGRVYFYQSEIPYDPPSKAAWGHDGQTGYASYKVADKVTNHEAWGMGVYSVFQAAPLQSETAFEAPDKPGVKLHHLVVCRLAKGGIKHVLNEKGGQTVSQFKATLD